MKYGLGLDIGISSIGFAVIEHDIKNFTGQILEAGVRIFTAAEQPKTGASLALPRRDARGVRRRLQRRNSRLYQLRKLFIANKFITQEEIENLYAQNQQITDVWDLRKEALSRKLSNKEFYRILMHIAKRRGFKSIRKSEEAKKEGDLLKSIRENLEKFENGGYKTIGEMFATIYQNEPKRNKRKNYQNSIPRSLLFDEITVIFNVQREFGLEFANENIENSYKEIAFYQRPLQSMEDKIGYCTFEQNEKRAPKCALTSEKFIAAAKLVNISIISDLGDSRYFTGDEIKQIIELAYKNSKVTFAQVKKLLNLDELDKFSSLNYNKLDKTGKKQNPETSTLIEFKNYHAIKKAIEKTLGDEYFENIKNDENLFNNIAAALTYEKSDETIISKMKEFGICDEIIECVKDLSMSKTSHLSIKAMQNILPYLFDGKKYSESCLLAGYNHLEISSNKQNYLPALNSEELTTNPVVNRAIAQTRKVVNALLRKYGAFDNIIIEMARDLSKTHQERMDIIKKQEEFQKQKDLARERCIESGLNPDKPKSNLLKFRLWEEQQGFCIYSGKYIDPKKLADPDYTDIDHIIPYSKSYDDSLNNKVLCLADENRQKGNKIPYEYIGETKWYDFVQRVKSYNLKSAKINRLTKKSYSKEGFKSRNLNDTRYMAKFIKDYIKENLDTKVETRNGSLTGFLRTQWGLVKNRAENDRHHALDAIVLACSTQGMVQYLSTISAKIEGYEFINGSKPRFKKPWMAFSEDVEKAISEIFVSRAVRARISGQLHDATIRSAKHINEGFTTLKVPLENIKLEHLEKMYDKERNIKLYNVIKERLLEFNNDPKRAFETPIYMPLSEEKLKQGQKPHEIKSIKIMDKSTSGVFVHNGFAQNTSMPRVDVFKKKNKKGKYEFFLVPIYVANFGGELPNEAISTGKNKIFIDDTYDFCFSLYPDTLISINKTGKIEDKQFWYYRSCHRKNGSLHVDSPDRSINVELGVKTIYSIKKYQIDVLGKFHEVKNEKRIGIKGKNNGL